MMTSRDRSTRKLTLLDALCCLIAPLWALAHPLKISSQLLKLAEASGLGHAAIQ